MQYAFTSPRTVGACPRGEIDSIEPRRPLNILLRIIFYCKLQWRRASTIFVSSRIPWRAASELAWRGRVRSLLACAHAHRGRTWAAWSRSPVARLLSVRLPHQPGAHRAAPPDRADHGVTAD